VKKLTTIPRSNRLVLSDDPKDAIRPSPGFAKKDLATFKLHLIGLFGYGRPYWLEQRQILLRSNR